MRGTNSWGDELFLARDCLGTFWELNSKQPHENILNFLRGHAVVVFHDQRCQCRTDGWPLSAVRYSEAFDRSFAVGSRASKTCGQNNVSNSSWPVTDSQTHLFHLNVVPHAGSREHGMAFIRERLDQAFLGSNSVPTRCHIYSLSNLP